MHIFIGFNAEIRKRQITLDPRPHPNFISSASPVGRNSGESGEENDSCVYP